MRWQEQPTLPPDHNQVWHQIRPQSEHALRPGRSTRVGLGITDQVLSSASNMLAVFAIAGVSTIVQFGSISLAIAGVMAMVLLCRGLLGTPIALLSGEPVRLQDEANHALALAAVLGLVVGVIIAVCATFTNDPWSVALVGMAAPAILIQDSARYACVAAEKPAIAVASDGSWAAGSALLFIVAGWLAPDVSARVAVGAWAGLAYLALLIIQMRSGFHPVFGGIANWVRSTAADRSRYGATSAIGATNSMLILFVVAALVGSSAIAALRGSASVLGPLNILIASMALVVVPELRRLSGATPGAYWRPMGRVALLMCTIPVTVGVLSVFVPDVWGEILLGPTWLVAQPLLPITAIEYVALTWSYSADTILRSQANSRAVLTRQLVHSALITGGATIAAIAFGSAIAVATGIAMGASVAAAVGIVLTFKGSKVRRPDL